MHHDVNITVEIIFCQMISSLALLKVLWFIFCEIQLVPHMHDHHPMSKTLTDKPLKTLKYHILRKSFNIWIKKMIRLLLHENILTHLLSFVCVFNPNKDGGQK